MTEVGNAYHLSRRWKRREDVDAARRSKELSPKSKRPTNGKREITRNGSWFGNIIESFNQLIGSRK